jgi:hypothetical protein
MADCSGSAGQDIVFVRAVVGFVNFYPQKPNIPNSYSIVIEGILEMVHTVR